MSSNISFSDIDKYVSFLNKKEKNAKSFDLTKIQIYSKYNNGDVTCNGIKYSGKCFFISLAMMLHDMNPCITISQFVSDMILISGIMNSNQKVELINFGEEIEWTNFDQIKTMCSIYPFLENYRIEIYSGIKSEFNWKTESQTVYTDPTPTLVFNDHVVNLEKTIRIIQTINPEHFELITNPNSDFFQPILLNMIEPEVFKLHSDIVNYNQKINDEQFAKQLEEEELLSQISNLHLEEADNDKLFIEYCQRENIY